MNLIFIIFFAVVPNKNLQSTRPIKLLPYLTRVSHSLETRTTWTREPKFSLHQPHFPSNQTEGEKKQKPKHTEEAWSIYVSVYSNLIRPTWIHSIMTGRITQKKRINPNLDNAGDSQNLREGEEWGMGGGLDDEVDERGTLEVRRSLHELLYRLGFSLLCSHFRFKSQKHWAVVRNRKLNASKSVTAKTLRFRCDIYLLLIFLNLR